MSATLRTILRRPFTRGCRRDSAYLFVSFWAGLLGFTFAVTAVSVVAGVSILIVGLPLAVLVAHADRRWCGIERRRAGAVLGRPVPARYRPPAGTGRVARALSVLRDRQTWFDVGWMLASLPLGIVGFWLVVLVWPAAFALVTTPIWLWSIPGWLHRHDVALSILFPLLAYPAAVAAAWLVRGYAVLHARTAEGLLNPGRAEQLEARVQTLAETRAGAVDAAVGELQRVERDLHDGAQARLVALAMDLGMAEQRLAHADPDSAREHVASAREQAQAAMADLRDLVRGIGPSILSDRGLDAALSALAGGRRPPVELDVDVSGGAVTPAQTAAYFVAAEALANVRKHARANAVSVHVWESPKDRLIVEVTDDGVGGADPGAGSGLAGLRKRVAALDGTLSVTSPAGGPTVVRAELPCGS